jgi:uncharacterized membrane protein
VFRSEQDIRILHVGRPWTIMTLGLAFVGIASALALWPGTALLAFLRWLDSGICAQLPTHSFYPGGEQLPLCARNTGIYLGFMLTLFMLHATGRGKAQEMPRWPIVLLLVAGIVALAIDGLNSFLLDLGLFHLYQPYNTLRLATGLLTGFALATLTLPMLNRLFWRAYNEQRSITSWSTLLLFLTGLLLSFFVVVSQSWLVLYPIALLSTGGLLTALGIVNLIPLVAISRREQAFEHYRALLPFFGLALLLATGELLALAQLKLVLLHALGV